MDIVENTLTVDEVIDMISEVLREADGEFIEDIAKRVLTHSVTYLSDSIFDVSVPTE